MNGQFVEQLQARLLQLVDPSKPPEPQRIAPTQANLSGQTPTFRVPFGHLSDQSNGANSLMRDYLDTNLSVPATVQATLSDGSHTS